MLEKAGIPRFKKRHAGCSIVGRDCGSRRDCRGASAADWING
jgi:hypothetical protein